MLKNWLISLFLFLPSWALAQTAPQPARLTDARIIRELSRRTQWDWFWTGYTHANYAEGKTIPVTVLESPAEVAVFLAALGQYVVFDLDGKITDGRVFPPTTNEAAMNEYLRTFGDTPGSRPIPGISGSSTTGQARRDPRTIEAKKAAMRERSFAFVLPKLEPPDYIVRTQAPPDLPQFQSAVRMQARDWYEPSCGMGQLSIPYFSPDDPVVFVYAELGSCGTGIFDFHLLKNGQWQVGRLWPHAAPGSAPGPSGSNDWSHTIQKVLEHRLATIPIP